jgi:hypothetical protein
MNLELDELIDNELNTTPYQSMNERDKRLCKRNLIKLFESFQDNNDAIINNIILDNNNKFLKYHYNTLHFLLFSYMSMFSVFIIGFFFLNCA